MEIEARAEVERASSQSTPSDYSIDVDSMETAVEMQVQCNVEAQAEMDVIAAAEAKAMASTPRAEVVTEVKQSQPIYKAATKSLNGSGMTGYLDDLKTAGPSTFVRNAYANREEANINTPPPTMPSRMEDVDARGFDVASGTGICRDDYDDFGDCCRGVRQLGGYSSPGGVCCSTPSRAVATFRT